MRSSILSPPRRKRRILRNPSIVSTEFDYDPAMAEFMNQASPYYDHFSSPLAPHDTSSIPVVSLGNRLTALWQRFGYRSAAVWEEGGDQEQGHKREPRFKNVQWDENEAPRRPADRWFLLLVLMLLFSVLCNVFLIVEGSVGRRFQRETGVGDVFRVKEYGTNWTCYRTGKAFWGQALTDRPL